jgi:hypothetical protein
MGSHSLGCLLACVLVSSWGCQGGRATPVAPDPPVATAESVTITGGADALRTRFFSDFTLTVNMSDRTTQVVTTQAVWTTSDTSIATVDAHGRVDAIRNGTVALNATFQGRSASRTIRIVHNYGGAWIGTYTARSCEQSGVFAASRYCQNLGATPSTLGLELAQTGTNVDEISGMISLRGLVGPVSGRVTDDGRLVLTASYVSVNGGASQRVEVPRWSSAPSGPIGMTGSFVQTLVVVGSDGQAIQTNDIASATKTSDSTAGVR